VDVMSDAPVITPLTPLGAFVTRVGRHPGQAALATYLARLREQARRGRCSIAILRAWHRLEHQSNLLCQ